MGGTRSGFQGTRKLTVEESFSIRVTDFYRRRGSPSSSGILTCKRSDQSECHVHYVVNFRGPRAISLSYHRGVDDIRLLIHLQTTETRFGGYRC